MRNREDLFANSDKLPSSGSKIKTSFAFSKTEVFLSTWMGGTVCSEEASSLSKVCSEQRKHQAGPSPPCRRPRSLLHVADDRQDAHLLLGRVRVLILLLGHSRAQAVEPPTVLGIIYTVLKKQLFHPKERHSCQQ